MARFKHILLTFLLLMSYSCAAHVPVQPKTITDLRLGDERCSVHDEALIEATNSVDFERGSYRGEYYAIRDALFPCAFDDPLSVGKMALVTYCPKCRAAKRKYLRVGTAMTWEEIWNLDVSEFIERQRRELNGEYSSE